MAKMGIIQRLSCKAEELIIQGMKDGKPSWELFKKYAKVELTPPKMSEFPQILRDFNKIADGFKKQKWRNVTVKEAVVNTMITIEVACWFFVGECIGKFHIAGYKV